ncbi:MAG: homogentisate 1,2-dioxygenase [Phycisphaerae bacterium]|nr:homogentisate 1,2-dioxygenase [Phycisphaerae bacterium]NUQ48039.1 homogentisate 1,2-dioxygenase [Phycisphaerae bacterium]
MIHWHSLGKYPPKPHTAFYEEGKLLMEHCHTREGFEGPFSILYYRVPPTDENAVERLAVPGFCPFEPLAEQPLYRRHIKTQDLKLRGDFLDARRVLLFNSDVQMSMVKPTEKTSRFFCNGDGDECYFVYKGSGRFETLFGVLPFRERDYVIVPRCVPYRIHWDGPNPEFFVFEGRGFIDVPKEWRNRHGQITMYAPYTHRDFVLPRTLLAYDRAAHGTAPFQLVVKRADVLTVHLHPHFPYELVGWEGMVYPVAFNIHDYQPKTSTIHLPPTIHLTFAGNEFVICSFVPRKVDYYDREGRKAIPCPYGHASVHMDEILFYVDGNFTSRRGIDSGSISLHPAGIPHGPHPGTYEKSIGHDRTSELAVMCDTYKQLRLTTAAHEVEDKDYHLTWVAKEGGGVDVPGAR